MKIPFTDQELQWIALGRKTTITDTQKYGKVNSQFKAGKEKFVLTNVECLTLEQAKKKYYKQEGFFNEHDFRLYWERRHNTTYKPDLMVWIHSFCEMIEEK